jgi:two-component system phosphate regulon sensor histidine kinase PhoR
MSLRASVLAAIITSTAALVLALLLLQTPLVEVRQTVYSRADLLDVASEGGRRLAAGEAPDLVADHVGATRAAHVMILDVEGTVLGDTAVDGHHLDALEPVEVDTPEVQLAWSRGEGWAIRAAPDGTPTLFAARAEAGWVVRASRPVATMDAARASIQELVIAGGLIAILASLLLSYVITQHMVRPIESVTRTADALAKGDLSTRSGLDRSDEIGRLGRSLDTMAERLDRQLRSATEEEARLRTMLDSMVEAVFATDRAGVITLTNRALEGMVPGTALGRKVKDAIRNEDLKAAVRTALAGEETTVALDAELSGEPRALRARVTPLPEVGGIIAVLHDVTDLKRADRIRRDFVANASHELRTPLTAIRGFAETLRDTPDPPRETTDRFLDAILRHTHRLQRLVDDLLALSRAESDDQEFDLGPVAVGPIARDVASGLEAKGGQRSIEVTLTGFSDLPDAHANAWALDHVLVNLVDNAVKYTPEGGRVHLRGIADERFVVIEVADAGPGIAVDQRRRIFERFYRIDAGRTRTQGGTGLGLAIVKHLMQRMGGEIEVASVVGEGTTFRVRLARASDAPNEPSVARDETPPQR